MRRAGDDRDFLALGSVGRTFSISTSFAAEARRVR